jgi:hypothetical protein
MRKRLLLICFILQATLAFSQSNLLVLKKKNHTVQTWVEGSPIYFQFSNKQWITGYVKDIIKDSLLIDMFIVRRYVNQLGVFAVDTGKAGLLKLHVKEIYAVPTRKRSRSLLTMGGFYQIGSAAYMALNITNSLLKGEQVFSPENNKRLGIAAAVFAFGTLLSATEKEEIVLGKKYKMEIWHAGNTP